jgi:hypothetical protein
VLPSKKQSPVPITAAQGDGCIPQAAIAIWYQAREPYGEGATPALLTIFILRTNYQKYPQFSS